MKNIHMTSRFIFLTFISSLSTTSQAIQSKESDEASETEIAEAIIMSSKPRGKITFWRSDKLGLIYGYDERWKPANPSQRDTVSVINWTTQASGGLMATCYIQSADVTKIAEFQLKQIKENTKAVVDAQIKKGKQHDPNTRLISWRLATQDNYPVIYIERDSQVKNIDASYSYRLYSIYTVWNDHEIVFSCGSEIPIKSPNMAGIVEVPIKNILRTLQFTRTPK